MPYIRQEDRESIGVACPVFAPGDLNYVISMALKSYWLHSQQTYTDINDIMGAIESAKLEFYRRVAVPYEEEKIKTNGDIY